MLTGDSRKDFILIASGNYFGVSGGAASLTRLHNSEPLNNFLDDGNYMLLSASLDCKEKEANIHFSNKVELINEKEKILIFLKLKPDVITPDNLHKDIIISSVLDSPLITLYHALQKLYAPMLIKDGKWSDKFDPALQSLLLQLESGLGTVIRKQSFISGAQARDTVDLSTILTPFDELQYWIYEANTSDTIMLKAAKQLSDILGPLVKSFDSLGCCEETLDMTYNALDDIWRTDTIKYPQDRMVHLLEVIGNFHVRSLQSKLSGLQLWDLSFNLIEESLLEALHLCSKWSDVCQKLTSTFWPQDSLHCWEGEPYVPNQVLLFSTRLNEILDIRLRHTQLIGLFSVSEQAKHGMESAFLPFLNLNAFQCNPYTEPYWQAAVCQFENSLRSTEECVANKLKSLFLDIIDNPLQLLQNFKRYFMLIKIPYVAKTLAPERALLLSHLKEYILLKKKEFIDMNEDNFDNKNGKFMVTTEISLTVRLISWTRQLELKMKDIDICVNKFFHDLPEFNALLNHLSEFIKELHAYQNEKFCFWLEEVQDLINDNTLSLCTGEPVLSFAKDLSMQVTYNSRLCILMRDVRQLGILGFNIPAGVKRCVDLAKTFNKQAKELQQIANFHNSIGDQMIVSQRSLMLDAAIHLENLVKQQSGIVWSDTKALNKYIIQLQQATEKLSVENRKLRGHHSAICNMVVSLMTTDLLRHQQLWKDNLLEIRHLMSRLEQQGYSKENMKTWKAHWDRQLYKALEHQYQMGLTVLNENLPEIKVELAYRQRRLQFHPPIEEIQTKYYGHLKRFFTIPCVFKGVNDVINENLIFPVIIDRNAHLYSSIYKKADIIFEKLETLQAKFVNWVCFGTVNIDEFVRQHLTSVDDWDRSFRGVKAKSQEVGRLPSDEKIDCIIINFAPIKAVIDDHLQAVWDTLKTSLRMSIFHDVRAVEDFVKNAADTLSKPPCTVEEIGLSYTRRHEYEEKSVEIYQLFQQAEIKNKLLGLWVKEKVESVANLKSSWDTFQRQMDYHKEMITKQVDDVKTSLSRQMQSFEREVEHFSDVWQQVKPKHGSSESTEEQIRSYILFIKNKRVEFDDLSAKYQQLRENCHWFGLNEPKFLSMEKLEHELLEAETSWFLFEEFQEGMKKYSSEQWLVIRGKTFLFEDYLIEWMEKLKPGLSGKEDDMTSRLIQEIDAYKACIPLLKYCHGDMFCEEHWTELFEILGIGHISSIERLLLGDLLNVKEIMILKATNIKDLTKRAQEESNIRQALNELDAWAVTASFSFTDYSDSSGCVLSLIREWSDVFSKIGDNQSLLQSLKASPYYKTFSDRGSIWECKLADLDEYLHNLNHIQRKWVYLEPIFGRGALAKEESRFKRINDEFRSLLSDIHNSKRIISICNMPGLKKNLNTLLDQLQRCQKSLNDFLEAKRLRFPRFYFIGDDDLLEILGQSTNPTVIQAHLKKLFAGIHAVEFDDDFRYILGMKSLEGELVNLQNKIYISQDVENWLGNLANEMKSTLCNLLVTYVNSRASSKPYKDIDVVMYPQQITCLGELILFSKHCEDAITRGMLNTFLEELKSCIHHYAGTDVKQNLENKVLNLKIKALILDAIHCISILEQLLSAGVNSVSDWNWQKQLRFYFHNEEVIVKMVDSEFKYSFEYQGNTPRLVHTPLTDKCYLSLTQALSMGLGGNPYGPAGTGKTESVKALGGLLGRQVLVFNCDEGIDVDSMGRILIGIVKCGAWGCFDEFNRLEEVVLSAVSMQIHAIQAGLKNHTHIALLLGSEIQIDPNSGIFITLNPLGKGYGGRQRLPDNLKQLFCPVVMSVPDSELIAEVLLFSEGYRFARDISRKVVAVFSLSRELLTPQHHYDWGLRALKTVLKSCGSHLQMTKCNLTDEEKLEHACEVFESQLAVQALCMNTISKLTFSDCQRFHSLIRDVFVEVEFKEVGYEALKGFINESCMELGLTVIMTQVQKMIELYEQMQQRTGVVIVGPSGSSKTTIWKTLLHALRKMRKNVKHYIINPKAITRVQLLGYIDIDTREWTDGVLTQIARKVAKEPQDVISWIIFDGDIDPEWVEALNSVLDDNRLLTMPSGERIQFGSNINLLFETHELQYASPATVSRMGVIHLSDEDIDLKAIVTTWINANCGDNKMDLTNLINDYFYKAVHWVYSKNDFALDLSRLSLVMNQLALLKNIKNQFHFAMALIGGLGKTLNANSQEVFAKQVFHWIEKRISETQSALNYYYDDTANDLIMYSSEGSDDITLESLCKDVLPVVPTSCMQSHVNTIIPWLHESEKKGFLLVGPEGCGKSLLLHHCFQMQKSTQVVIIHCSATTSPHCILQKLHQVCLVVTSNNGRVYKPKDCEKLILYLRDINLSKPDKWGTSQLIAFLQQIISYNGFYDTNLEWVWLESIQIVGSLAVSNMLGRYSLSPRFTSLVRIYNMSYPTKDELQRICSAYLHPILFNCLPLHPIWSVSSKVFHLAGTLVNIYDQTCKTFSVDEWSHYSFTPRELLKCVLGLLRYDLKSFINDVTSQSIIEIVAYECRRIFQDRLVGIDSKYKQENILQSIMNHEWGIDLEITKGIHHYYCSWGAGAKATVSSSSPVPFIGRPLGKLSAEDLQNVVEKGILQYSREHRKLDIIIFDEVLDQVSKIDRVLSLSEGSLLLSGPSGVGRHSLLSIVATLHGMKVLSPRICLDYNRKKFFGDLKMAMQATGIEGQEIVFILEDYQLIEKEFLEIINGLISTGEIPGLYSPEEIDHLLATIRDEVAQEGFRGSIISFFAQRVKKNLHFALILDSSNPNLSAYFESNPALYKLCYVNWIEGWCKRSMLKIPQVLLPKTLSDELLDSNAKGASSQIVIDDELINNFYRVHISCPINVATPRRYLAFVNSYKNIFTVKKAKLEEQKRHLEVGVSKLNEAKIIVDKLKSEASEQSILLKEKQTEADRALDLITSSMQNAGDQKTEMESLRGETLKENEKLSKRKKEIDAELSEIEPLVQEAKTAVQNIKSESLAEIRSLRAPPDVIRDILEAVLNLMGNYDTSWNSMKSFLAKRGVKEEICSFDARTITSQNREAVEELLKTRKESFDPKYAKRASVAAAPLASWVQANVRYAKVLNKIKPLEQEQMLLQRNLNKAEGRMGKLSLDLESVDKYVAELKERLNRFTKEAASIELNLKKAHETIHAAESLVEKLEDEFNRWSRQIGELSEQLVVLPIQTLLAAAFVTYLSSLVEYSRYKLLNEWMQTMKTERIDLRKFLSCEKELVQWHNEGLPFDDLSLENALIINQASLRPLMIDPACKATEWLKKHLKDARLEVIAQHDPNFSSVLELAIRFGKTLLIQNVTNIEPVLYPLLRYDLIAMGPRYFVQIGDKLIDYHEDFRLFLSTSSSHVNISPQADSIVTTVNFTTTRASLNGQLLALAIQHDKPELEERQSKLLHQEEELKAQVSQLEDYLLEQLGNAHGNILDNKELLSSLNDAKKSSATVVQSLNESIKLQCAIAKERDAYLPLAEFGSTLFFAVTNLTKINNMYSFSLSSFLQLFKRALSLTADDGDILIRISKLKEQLQNLVYKFVSKAMFKADHLMLALHFIHALNIDLFEKNEWEAFIGTLVADLKVDFAEMKKSLPSWINEERALAFSLLKSVFPDLYTNLKLDNAPLWSNFSNSSRCEHDIPDEVVKKVSFFQQLLIVQTLRPDRLQSAMTLFCTRVLGLSPAPITFNKLCEETVADEPVLIIISVGADPSQELQEIASKVVGEEHYHQIAMGQGQADTAIHLLKECAKNGEWLCLSNLHLVTTWLPVLEKEYSCITRHPSFRLWLTSEPHPNFSDSLLQSCLKVTFEAPPGIRQNLQRTYNSWPIEFISKSGSVTRAQMLFALAWFHALVQERRNFIPEGWSKFYEFSYSDLKTGAHIIDRFCERSGRSSMQWEFIYGLFESVVYGGKVDNIFDMQVLTTYLKEFFNSEVITGATQGKKYLIPGVNLPLSYRHSDYVNLIDKLPDENHPKYFGLPANIEQSAERAFSNHVISQLRLLSRSSETVQKYDREGWQAELSPILNLWKKLNQNSKLVRAQVLSPSDFSNPLTSVIQLEYYIAISTVQYIHSTLAAVSKALRGTSLLIGDILQLATSLVQQETPALWLKYWQGPSDPIKYLRLLMMKAIAIDRWMQKNEKGTLLSEPLNMTELFNPERFINALRQQTARELSTSMDDLMLVTVWRGSIPNATFPIRLTSLYITGCVFDGIQLMENSHNSPNFTLVPDPIVAWIPKNKCIYAVEEVLPIPLYDCKERTSVVTCLDVPCVKDKAKWIKCAVALFLESI